MSIFYEIEFAKYILPYLSDDAFTYFTERFLLILLNT